MQLTDIFTLEQHKYEDLIFLGTVFAVIMGIVMIGVYITNIYIPFKAQRNYIKMEMRRSYGSEHEHWKKELKRLYLRHIPVIGLFARKKHR